MWVLTNWAVSASTWMPHPPRKPRNAATVGIEVIRRVLSEREGATRGRGIVGRQAEVEARRGVAPGQAVALALMLTRDRIGSGTTVPTPGQGHGLDQGHAVTRTQGHAPTRPIPLDGASGGVWPGEAPTTSPAPITIPLGVGGMCLVVEVGGLQEGTTIIEGVGEVRTNPGGRVEAIKTTITVILVRAISITRRQDATRGSTVAIQGTRNGRAHREKVRKRVL
uniref:Uncharacterized protein n=1 Tax=Cacopsylla melanoneura TaxID=428564 RepID=A0A8D8TDI5_9HEMI